MSWNRIIKNEKRTKCRLKNRQERNRYEEHSIEKT